MKNIAPPSSRICNHCKWCSIKIADNTFWSQTKKSSSYFSTGRLSRCSFDVIYVLDSNGSTTDSKKLSRKSLGHQFLTSKTNSQTQFWAIVGTDVCHIFRINMFHTTISENGWLWFIYMGATKSVKRKRTSI